MLASRVVLGSFSFAALLVAACEQDRVFMGSGGSSSSSTSVSSGGSVASSSSTASSSSSAGAIDVNGTETVTYLTGQVRTTVKPDLTSAMISVLAGPTFETYSGTGSSIGTFKVPGVPAGEYFLSFVDPGTTAATPTFYVTSSLAPDMSRTVAGRSDAVPVTQPTQVTVSLTGLDAWAAGDSLWLVSPGAGVNGFLLPVACKAPVPLMATSFMGTFDASAWFSRPDLIDAAKNDHVFLFQHETAMQAGYATSTVARSVSVGTLTMADGQPASIPAALVATPQNNTASVNWATTQFEALKAEVNPGATVLGHDFLLTGQWGLPSDGDTGLSALLLQFSPPAGSDVTNAQFTFGDPFGGFGYVAAVTTTFVVAMAAPQASPTNIGVLVGYTADLPTFELQNPAAPPISPVTNVLVDGQPGFAGGNLSSSTPTITFSAPATGKAARYIVRALELTKNAGGNTVVNEVAEVHGAHPSLQMPPGALTSGSSYAFNIAAITYPGITVDAEATPRKAPWPAAFAQTLVGPFTVP